MRQIQPCEVSQARSVQTTYFVRGSDTIVDSQIPNVVDMEHDQRFKTLLRTFFADFLRLFFAQWAARFDLSRIEWLDKEVVAGSPESPVHVTDLLARVHALQTVEGIHSANDESWLILVHTEIDSGDSATRIREKMPEYYWQLRATYGMPVLPIVLFLQMNLDGVGEDVVIERFWEMEVNAFRFLRVGLLGLDAIEYVQGDNWLGVALSALMKIPPERVAWLGAEALRRLCGAPLPFTDRYLLAECVQAYLPLKAPEQAAFQKLLESEPYTEVRAMNQTVFEKGIERGIERGKLLGQQKMAISMFREKFGVTPEPLREHVAHLPEHELRALIVRLINANSPDQLGLTMSAN